MEIKTKTQGTKVLIVGGVAGGASCAARLRRLDEPAQIIMVERGPYVSYANCGLPYHVGGVIEKEASLLVANEAMFRNQFAIDVRTRCEAIAISPEKKTVDLRNVATGEVTTESYDARGGDRRRFHRPGDGGKPRPPRVRGDAGRDARRSRMGAQQGAKQSASMNSCTPRITNKTFYP
jgi:Pyridine nucleotide-disulphide oxidoreductase